MKGSMKEWLKAYKAEKVKRAFPILTFPAVRVKGWSVKDALFDADKQAEAMIWLAENTDSAAAVGFMDLSVEAEAFGANVRYFESEVPTVTAPLIEFDPEAVENVRVPKVGAGRTGLFVDAVKKACESISDKPVFAGIIGPYSLAGRLLGVSDIMMDSYDDPDTVHAVLKKATEFLKEYALAFKNAGANGVMMAEPVSGLLSPAMEAEFSSPYVKEIAEAVQDENFLFFYHNCGANVVRMTDSLSSFHADGYHFGNAVDMKEMLDNMPKDTLVMGNIDPAGEFRMGTPESITAATRALYERAKEYDNFVMSSGCDIPPETPWENIEAFYAVVREMREKNQ